MNPALLLLLMTQQPGLSMGTKAPLWFGVFLLLALLATGWVLGYLIGAALFAS